MRSETCNHFVRACEVTVGFRLSANKPHDSLRTKSAYRHEPGRLRLSHAGQRVRRARAIHMCDQSHRCDYNVKYELLSVDDLVAAPFDLGYTHNGGAWSVGQLGEMSAPLVSRNEEQRLWSTSAQRRDPSGQEGMGGVTGQDYENTRRVPSADDTEIPDEN
ncbi:hypothetical protein Bbelb_337240 [Branchiostoma belcheri]|nr:hypothetical protein Bbelb_337240 [Branchiostoma belcheri]